MATIRIADKDTLDKVKELLEGSGGVNGYPNVSVLKYTSNAEITITGCGKVTFLAAVTIKIIELDNVSVDGTVAGKEVLTFEKGIKFKILDSDNFIAALVQLVN